eukprot:NODE_5240_length_680_cov_30.958409_g5077_i0.p1 GENE.NODE_5240_length_680_cov_30.958409_g5077_i0~~NODE_5240_length_680_cov_30.958409_g5077_i0.p1  ORF type:complete len:113 (-),score=0.13 NODE_5240_length_680_cov_30.958409_g5077_i0:9-347(-)
MLAMDLISSLDRITPQPSCPARLKLASTWGQHFASFFSSPHVPFFFLSRQSTWSNIAYNTRRIVWPTNLCFSLPFIYPFFVLDATYIYRVARHCEVFAAPHTPTCRYSVINS